MALDLVSSIFSACMYIHEQVMLCKNNNSHVHKLQRVLYSLEEPLKKLKEDEEKADKKLQVLHDIMFLIKDLQEFLDSKIFQKKLFRIARRKKIKEDLEGYQQDLNEQVNLLSLGVITEVNEKVNKVDENVETVLGEIAVIKDEIKKYNKSIEEEKPAEFNFNDLSILDLQKMFGMDKKGATIIRNAINTNNKEQVDSFDLMYAKRILKKGKIPDQAEFCFTSWDVDSNGSLSQEEIYDTMYNILRLKSLHGYVKSFGNKKWFLAFEKQPEEKQNHFYKLIEKEIIERAEQLKISDEISLIFQKAKVNKEQEIEKDEYIKYCMDQSSSLLDIFCDSLCSVMSIKRKRRREKMAIKIEQVSQGENASRDYKDEEEEEQEKEKQKEKEEVKIEKEENDEVEKEVEKENEKEVEKENEKEVEKENEKENQKEIEEKDEKEKENEKEINYQSDKWDGRIEKSTINIYNNGKTIKKLEKGWDWIRGTKVMSHNTGVYHYGIKIDSHNNFENPYLMMGIVPSASTSHTYSSGYCFTGDDSGQWEGRYCLNKASGYGNGCRIKTGDIIHVIVDTDSKNLSFKLNSQDLGICQDNIPNECILSVDLCSKNDQITLLENGDQSEGNDQDNIGIIDQNSSDLKEERLKCHVGDLIKQYKWSSEWTNIRPFQVGKKHFNFEYKNNTGRADILRVNNDGSLSKEEPHKYNWSKGWTTTQFYTINGITYLLLLKKETGLAKIHKMNENGSLGELVEEHYWSSGWTNIKPFQIGKKHYLFQYKTNHGIADILMVNNDGTIGENLHRYKWSKGWTTTEFYIINGITFLFLLKKDNGIIQINKMNENGSLGELVEEHYWSSGWTNIKPFQKGGQHYLFAYKANHGIADILMVNNNGTIGETLHKHQWSKGWTTTEFYTIKGNTYLFLLKKTNGQVKIHIMGKRESPESKKKGPIDLKQARLKCLVGDLIKKYKWSSEWTNIKPFQVGNKHYNFEYKNNNGRADIMMLNNDGSLGKTLHKYKWSKGWTTTEFYTIKGTTYLLLLKMDTQVAMVHKMNENGSLGELVKEIKCSSGWTNIRPFQIGNKHYLFGYKANDGRVDILMLNNNGTIGKILHQSKWSKGWTTTELYTIKGNTYLLLLKKGNGLVKIHKMNENGSVGKLVEKHNWEAGWTNVMPFQVGKKHYLFTYMINKGRTHILLLNRDGTIGETLHKNKWSKGWSTTDFYTINGITYLLLLKKTNGLVKIHKMGKM
ncbi:spry domain containing socs box protein [Anaeramoeba flamelloides]|uniref:Spry domain containing socs box protein n=1 Tax=Anaeramoeba flamelloides TaxID=1746091 RepID=A0ABQ8XEF9_9EUKA|nr:spry domain containing socs box protein [Anaeramoeba flamelloides]